jgi:hypothetical protein
MKVVSADSGLHLVLEIGKKISSDFLKKKFEDNNILIEIIEENKRAYTVSLSYSGLDFKDIEIFKKKLF